MTADFVIETRNLDETLRDLDNIGPYVMDELFLTMHRAVDVTEAAVVQRTPVGVSGHARQGWSKAVVRLISEVRGVVANPLDYIYYVEHGRGPGKMPPIDNIELWVRRVLGIAEPESRSVAFLVARAIGVRGTKGAHMVEEGTKAVRGIITADFRAVPDRVKARVEAT
jgi:hypothetical protein